MAEELNMDLLHVVFDAMNKNFKEALKKKGYKKLVSPHEVLGVMFEEFTEFADAVKTDNRVGIIRELYDIGTVVILGLLSLI
jgi:hypothetical protein